MNDVDYLIEKEFITKEEIDIYIEVKELADLLEDCELESVTGAIVSQLRIFNREICVDIGKRLINKCIED